jgi:hypothetical protein
MEAPAVRSTSGKQSKVFRSAVTNGTRLHVQPVNDTAWSRRFKDILGEIISDPEQITP